MEKKNHKVIYKTFHNLTLRTDLSNDDFATLQWGFRNQYPRITVYTTKNIKSKDESVNYDKIIIAPFDITTLTMLLNSLERSVKSKEPYNVSVKCFNNKFINGKRTEEKIIQAIVKFTRTQDGINVISVIEENKPIIDFKLLPGEWHQFIGNDGLVITDKKILSYMYSLAYLNNVLSTMTSEMVLQNVSTNEVSIDNKSSNDILI